LGLNLEINLGIEETHQLQYCQ